MTDKTIQPLQFTYTFIFGNGETQSIHITLKPDTLELIREPHEELPEWTKLEFCKCPNCTLKKEDHPYCPVAASLVDIIDYFKNLVSFEKAEVRVEAKERTYIQRIDLQKGVSSMMGIFTVSCGCPILSTLRPMVRFHLPFASLEETMYRWISMYLVRQFFRKKNGCEPDWELKELTGDLEQIHTVNTTLLKRIKNQRAKDTHINALIILDIFAEFIAQSFIRDNLSKIEYLFEDTIK